MLSLLAQNDTGALQPGHPPDIHLTQVAVVSGLLYEPVCLSLSGQRQGGHGADTEQGSRQTPCNHILSDFQTAFFRPHSFRLQSFRLHAVLVPMLDHTETDKP